MRYDFASDNTVGLGPRSARGDARGRRRVRAVLRRRSVDARTAADAVREVFETDCDVYFVFNGTAANSLALATLCQPYHSVICHELAHIETDECGAPEFFSNGTKLLAGAGRPTAGSTRRRARSWSPDATDIHFPQAEGAEPHPAHRARHRLPARGDRRARRDRRGRRAAGAHGRRPLRQRGRPRSGAHPADITWRAGVDVLCFGGTKNGMGLGEAVVFFDRDAVRRVRLPLQAGRSAGVEDALPRRAVGPHARPTARGSNAGHANEMARQLADELERRGRPLAHPVEANAVFARPRRRPVGGAGASTGGWAVYDFIGGATRFVCSWQTQPELIHALVDDLTGRSAG